MNPVVLPLNSQQYLGWTESVIVTSVYENTASNVSQNASAGVYQDGNREGSPSYGVYTKYDITVTVGSDTLPFVPKPRDTVLWNSNTYTVLDVKSAQWLNFHTLKARNLILANGLADTATLTRPSLAQDAAGRQSQATYSTVASSIPCRVQPISGDASDVTGRRTMVRQFTAIVGTQLLPQAKDIFTAAGQSYTILGFKNPYRIDELQTLELELIENISGFPINQSLPVVSGSVLVGQTLTASSGTWSGSPSFAYQWYSGGVAVSGATSATYTLQSSDLGNLISVQVTATNGSGSTAAMSSTVGPVTQTSGLTGTYPP